MSACKRGWIIGLSLWALALLAGCSALQLGYSHGPMLAYRWLDRYADFTPEQRPRVKAAIDGWFDWHRSTQLPLYVQELARLQALAAHDISADQACALVEPWQGHAAQALEQALPALTELARGLSAEQLAHLERRYAANDADAVRTHLQADPAERRKASYERSLDRAETLYGRLDDGQRRRLADTLAASPFDAERWLAERRQRQRDILARLHQWRGGHGDTTAVHAGLRQLGEQMLHSPRADYRMHQVRVMAANCQLAAQLHNSSSPAQRRKLIEKLRGWEGELQALASSR